MSATATTIVQLGDKFAAVLRGWLSSTEWQEMLKRNAAHAARGDADICASHDFCDANMAMDEAFVQLLGREPDVVGEGDKPDYDLWNAAWAYAKRDHLGGTR